MDKLLISISVFLFSINCESQCVKFVKENCIGPDTCDANLNLIRDPQTCDCVLDIIRTNLTLSNLATYETLPSLGVLEISSNEYVEISRDGSVTSTGGQRQDFESDDIFDLTTGLTLSPNFGPVSANQYWIAFNVRIRSSPADGKVTIMTRDSANVISIMSGEADLSVITNYTTKYFVIKNPIQSSDTRVAISYSSNVLPKYTDSGGLGYRFIEDYLPSNLPNNRFGIIHWGLLYNANKEWLD